MPRVACIGIAAVMLLGLASMSHALEINQANEAELDSVKGLGPSSTARILKARTSGSFKDWADLMRRVKGIKPASAQRLSDSGLTVNGKPFQPSESAPP